MTPPPAPESARRSTSIAMVLAWLIPGLGHVPHMEAPEKTIPPLVAFLKAGLEK